MLGLGVEYPSHDSLMLQKCLFPSPLPSTQKEKRSQRKPTSEKQSKVRQVGNILHIKALAWTDPRVSCAGLDGLRRVGQKFSTE